MEVAAAAFAVYSDTLLVHLTVASAYKANAVAVYAIVALALYTDIAETDYAAAHTANTVNVCT